MDVKPEVNVFCLLLQKKIIEIVDYEGNYTNGVYCILSHLFRWSLTEFLEFTFLPSIFALENQILKEFPKCDPISCFQSFLCSIIPEHTNDVLSIPLKITPVHWVIKKKLVSPCRQNSAMKICFDSDSRIRCHSTRRWNSAEKLLSQILGGF